MSRVLRLLEGSCAVVAVLYATLLVLFTDSDALLIAYRNGDLDSTITVFAVACIGWLGLRMARSPRHLSAGLLVGGACAVGIMALLWWTTRPTVEEHHVTPAPSTGLFSDSQPSENSPGSAPPPAPPTAGP
ncbi:hypothetical protein OG758_10215 [Streptomyces sp. NBC_01474]|uniref:hypothetical protein n=1 Tax=unclassified Streptomyces TaxID=2593676 RepID=UPI002DDA1130|nr:MULTISPECIES: hypothetical protein [unclassified Streptomyces]WSD94502.1 hypothetical protein OG758_10215 [Streptomyces sp. NBC_01474]